MDRISKAMLVGCLFLVVGCSTSLYASYRVSCPSCSHNLSTFKEDCLPICRDVAQNSMKYNMRIPAGWSLSNINKERFTVNTLGKEGTETSISCICRFENLTTQQRNQVNHALDATS